MSSLASKMSLAQFDALLLWAKIANVIGHRTVPKSTNSAHLLRIPPILISSCYYTFFIMECESKEARIQLAVNAFKKRPI